VSSSLGEPEVQNPMLPKELSGRCLGYVGEVQQALRWWDTKQIAQCHSAQELWGECLSITH
jgi:hypothetical protein